VGIVSSGDSLRLAGRFCAGIEDRGTHGTAVAVTLRALPFLADAWAVCGLRADRATDAVSAVVVTLCATLASGTVATFS
jgi:hypothetical protein